MIGEINQGVKGQPNFNEVSNSIKLKSPSPMPRTYSIDICKVTQQDPYIRCRGNLAARMGTVYSEET